MLRLEKDEGISGGLELSASHCSDEDRDMV